ncbi:MAG: Y-family DNA polymerase [Muribaculaceae bacterium]|nr:Y-family DNA polymerase [Muribaculaceae bacterium]
MYCLADCNNFFVSCERLYDPTLNGRPVVVLSNNDGCVIARSNEAKAMGIPMGCPAFQIKKHTGSANFSQVVQLSARHTLYHDISLRIMSLLGRNCERLEVYSVDEAFFQAPFNDPAQNERFLRDLVERIYKYVGIPVSIGYAPTRTLAKIASHIAKKNPTTTQGVYGLTDASKIASALEKTAIGDVWGIGRRLTESLHNRGVATAAQFVEYPTSLIRSLYNITVAHTHAELKGIDCTAASPVTIAHKSIMNSRTFGGLITSRNEVQAAVVHFAEHCSRQLRREGSVAGTVMVYVRGDRYREDVPFYSNSCQLNLATPSSSALTIVHYALQAFSCIFKEGFAYRKAGVMLLNIKPEKTVQFNLFDKEDHNKQNRLMQAIDRINSRYATQTINLASTSSTGEWKPRQKHLNDKTQGCLHIYSGMIASSKKNKKNL